MNEDNAEIHVKIDPDLEELIPGYLDNRREDIKSIRAAVEKGDYESARITGHSMKGSGGGYGFNGITDIGKKIENAAKQSDQMAVFDALAELESYLNRVKVSFG